MYDVSSLRDSIAKKEKALLEAEQSPILQQTAQKAAEMAQQSRQNELSQSQDATTASGLPENAIGITAQSFQSGTTQGTGEGSPILQQAEQKAHAKLAAQQQMQGQEQNVENGREMDVDFNNSNDRMKSTGINQDAETKQHSAPTKEKTRNERLEGKKHPVTGVPFVLKQGNVGGKQVEVVVPEFENFYKTRLPEEMYCAPDRKQFKECNRQLKIELSTNVELRALFSEEQLAQIENEEIPDGYTWHHEVEAGVMILVNRNVHEKTGHTGGRYFWGGGTDNR